MRQVTTRTKKPSESFKNFPLLPHANRRWAKTIKGKQRYFGRWKDGWRAAFEKDQSKTDDPYAGRIPEKAAESDTRSQTCSRNSYPTSKPSSSAAS